MRRRTLLVSAAMTLAASLGGCFGGTDDADSEPTSDGSDSELHAADSDPEPDSNGQYDVPDDCPMSHDLDVDWPDEFDVDSAASLVVAYEKAYLEEIVIGEAESQVERLGYSVGYRPPVEEVDEGYLVEVGGGGAHYTPQLHLDAAVADAPVDATPVPKEQVEDDPLNELLGDAKTEGVAEMRIDPGSEVDHYIDLVASLSPDFEPLTEPASSGTAYFDIDEVTVELTLKADSFHGDMGLDARYYVDEYVLWRNASEDGSPRDGELLECRRPA